MIHTKEHEYTDNRLQFELNMFVKVWFGGRKDAFVIYLNIIIV